MANKQAAKESTIPMPIVILLVMLAAGAAMGGLNHTGKHAMNRHGYFDITYEWRNIEGGVTPNISRNGAPFFEKPPRLLLTSSYKIYKVNGRENDHVVASLKGLRDFTAEHDSMMQVQIQFVPTDGSMPPLPSISRDVTPTQSGVITRWP